MKGVIQHIVAWVIFATISAVVRIAELKWSVSAVFIYETYTKYLLAAIIFYTSYNQIFKKYFASNQIFKTVLLLLVLLFLNGILRHLIFSGLFVEFGIFPIYGYSFWQSFTIGIWWWYMFSLLGFGYYFLKKSINTERQLRIAETEKLQLKNQKLLLQYNYLQAQINPHFLYNTLNFLYTEAEGHSEKLASGIIALSSIMRYSVADGAQKDTICIGQELDILNKYIHLHQLRFGKNLNMQFTSNVINRNTLIPPYILITIAENAFKHGLFGKNDEPLLISLHCSNEQLRFCVVNTINTKHAVQNSTGVGLQNVSQRLEHSYGEQQQFVCRTEGNRFIVELEINFKSENITAAHNA